MSSWAVPYLQWGPIWSWTGVAAHAGLGGGQLFEAEPHPHSHRSGCFTANHGPEYLRQCLRLPCGETKREGWGCSRKVFGWTG